VLLMATNRHIHLAYWSLATGMFTVWLAWLMGSAFNLNGIVIAMLVSELSIAIVCSWLAYGAITNSLNRKAMPL
jgi:polyferredoxin